jgi:CRP-like cAMP-binding protein
VECRESGDVLTIDYDRLMEIYFQNPEFGYYFLRLTTDRLLQNHTRLQGLVEQNRKGQPAGRSRRPCGKRLRKRLKLTRRHVRRTRKRPCPTAMTGALKPC